MEQTIIVKTNEDFEKLIEYIKDKDFISYDTETDGVKKDSHIIGFSICADVDLAYYVILAYWDVETGAMIFLETNLLAKQFIQLLSGKNLIMQNAVFDCYMTLNNYGIDLMPSVHTDTMILAHIVDENRRVGLKELGVSMFGEDARKEQTEMKESVTRNGGLMTREHYELFKADADLIAKYGAKDALLTMKVFLLLVEDLHNQNLQDFFYNDESMPLLRGPTYDMNSTGLRVDFEALKKLRITLETECLEHKAIILKEIYDLVKHEYPGDKKTNQFNIGSSKQIAWLIFEVLEEEFGYLTKMGKDICRILGLKIPYNQAQKRAFRVEVSAKVGHVYEAGVLNPLTDKKTHDKKIVDFWNYVECTKVVQTGLAKKYKWVQHLLDHNRKEKMLNTYVSALERLSSYNIIRPSFLQHGTTSGRYSSRNPNFQNLPRDDKRIKACIIARSGKVFVGADYAQLEPRVFASFSQDTRLMECFSKGDDFYSVIGMEVFDKFDCVPKKEGPNAFGEKYPALRNISKAVGLAATYGTTAFKLAPMIKKSQEDAQEVIDNYFEKFPSVHKLMLDSHEMAKNDGRVVNLFGRPRRMSAALDIKAMYGKTDHADLPYEARNLLNLAINHRIQSTGASIVNRATIAIWNACKGLEQDDKRWAEVKIVLQVHDSVILEGPEELANQMVEVLQYCMQQTIVLPGVELVAEPKIGKSLAEV